MKTKKEDPPNSLEREGVIRTNWEGGALGGVGGRKEPATSNTAGASSWWGSFTQCGGTPPDDGRLCTPVTPLGGVCKARRSEES